MVSGSLGDGGVWAWRAAGAEKFEGTLCQVRVFGRQQVVSGSSDKTVRVGRGERRGAEKVHRLSCPCRFRRGKQVEWDKTVRWGRSGAERESSRAHSLCQFSVFGRRQAGGERVEDKTVRVWDVESGAELRKLGHTGFWSVSFSGDRKQVVVASYTTARCGARRAARS